MFCTTNIAPAYLCTTALAQQSASVAQMVSDFTSLSRICEMAIASVANHHRARIQPSVLVTCFSSRVYIDIRKHKWTKLQRKTNYHAFIASCRVNITTSACRILFWESNYWLHCSFRNLKDIEMNTRICVETSGEKRPYTPNRTSGYVSYSWTIIYYDRLWFGPNTDPG